MRLLTFLGVGNYAETVYAWQGQEYQAAFAPAATCEFLRPDEVVTFVTEDAQERIFPAFARTLPPGIALTPVPIPLGQNDGELWYIFSVVSAAVEPDATVAFDITHGLRSFPLIGLLAAAYLRASRNADLAAVLYGAYDVRDKSVEPHRTPVFDLSPMLGLLEWATAADRFSQTGDARALAALGKRQQRALADQAQGDPARLAQAGAIGKLAGALTEISESLRLIRPHHTMRTVAGLAQRVQEAKPALAQLAPAQPLSQLLDRITQAYGDLALDDPTLPAAVGANLLRQRAMIHWFAEREQWVQAVTLAREWLVSWTMVQLGSQNILDKDFRATVETVLGSESRSQREAGETGSAYRSVFLASVGEVDEVLKLWSTLTNIRNDINHAGMRADPARPKELISQIRACIEGIDARPV